MGNSSGTANQKKRRDIDLDSKWINEIVTNQEAMEKDLNIASQYVKSIELLNYNGLSIFVSLIVFASPS